jgi:8-oxo-dGTP pyrophosphatase MutT (NUDIX family)
MAAPQRGIAVRKCRAMAGAHDMSLRAEFARYASSSPEEPDVALFARLLQDEPEAFERHCLAGHFTGSAWLVSADGTRVLLTHHRKLDRWLQLGGHADGDSDLAAVALREATEESGLAGLALAPGMFDLDRHRIPARGEMPEHWHYDVRYVVRASDENFVVSEESLALAWHPIAAIAADEGADASLRRMAGKWLRRSPD